jgi:hypothetical protein
MSDISINTIDTEYLLFNTTVLNNSKYDKINIRQQFINDNKLFYKSRIFDIGKRIFKNKIDNSGIESNLVKSYNNFLIEAINYFQILDKNSIYQKEHDKVTNFSAKNLPDIDEDPKLTVERCDIDHIKDTHDKKVKKIEEYYSILESYNKENPPIIPKIKEINLKDNSLKTKGIHKKKKS